MSKVYDCSRSIKYKWLADKMLRRLGKNEQKRTVVDGFSVKASKDGFGKPSFSITAPDGIAIVRCNGPHVYTYFVESLQAPAILAGGKYYAANQPNSYWPDAPVEGSYDFRPDYYDDLEGADVTTRELELLTGPITSTASPFFGFYTFNAVDGYPTVLPATPVVRCMAGEVVQLAVIGIEATVERTNASSCTAIYINSSPSGENRYGREWRLDEWRLRGGHCYWLANGFSGYIKPLIPGNAGSPYVNPDVAAAFNLIRFGDATYRAMNYAFYEAYPVWMFYGDSYTTEDPIWDEANATAKFSWADMEPNIHAYTDVSSLTISTDLERQQLLQAVMYNLQSTYANKSRDGTSAFRLPDNHWFLGHDEAFYYWSRMTADVVWGFHQTGFDLFYMAIPTAANADGVRPTITYSGVAEVYTCTCDSISDTGLTCIGVSVGSPFVGWRELPLPADTLLFAKPVQATAASVLFYGIVQDGTDFALWQIRYTLADSSGSWELIGPIPAEDANVSMWDMAVFGDGALSMSMRNFWFQNVAFEQTLLMDTYCDTRTFAPWPTPINASYP